MLQTWFRKTFRIITALSLSGATFEEAIQTNLILLAILAIQHTLVAKATKQHVLHQVRTELFLALTLTHFSMTHVQYFGFPADLERSFYVFTSAALVHALACTPPHSSFSPTNHPSFSSLSVYWVPINDTVYSLSCGCAQGNMYKALIDILFATSVFVALFSTFVHNHGAVFGAC